MRLWRSAPDVFGELVTGQRAAAWRRYEYVATPPPIVCLCRLVWLERGSVPAETFFTVWSNVFMRGGLKAGEGSGPWRQFGIGTTAIQLAKTFGARVFATAGSDDNALRALV